MNELPPPDLGTLHGVKLPAWMWNKSRRTLVYVFSFDSDYVSFYHRGKIGNIGSSRVERSFNIEPYTGQDEGGIDELKRSAYLGTKELQ